MRFDFKSCSAVLFLSFSCYAFSQERSIAEKTLQNYEFYKETSITERRFSHKQIQPLIDEFRNNPKFTVQKVGESIEGRKLNLLSLGTGTVDVFLWSQMHGDETTATMAIFDILNFLTTDSLSSEKEELLQQVRLHFLPMLNPDGAEVFQRRNALGIDVNRDALRLQSPAGKTLKRIRDSLDAEFGFNLHDQSRYYNVEGTPNPAAISFLAPAYNYEKEVNKVRGNAMKLIVKMNEQLQKHIPGNVAKYNDDFEPRAFGDNIQKWGTSTILIESGGYPGDPEKQEIRKMNFLAILTALFSIANNEYQSANLADYEKIPQNDSKLFDLKLAGLQYDLLNETYILDLGINHSEVPINNNSGFYYRGRIVDQGDLSTNFGYEIRDVSGYKMKPGAIYPQTFENIEELKNLDFSKILAEGYIYIKILNLPEEKSYNAYPVQLVGEDFIVPIKLDIGANPTFYLEKDGKPEAAVINGFYTDLKNPEKDIKNGLILK